MNPKPVDMYLTGRDALRMERLLPGPPELVWRYLTERDLLATWIADGDITPRIGGRVSMPQQRDALPINTGNVIRGTVTEWDPPRALAYTWEDSGGAPDSHVRFTLTPHANGTLLTIVHTRLPAGALQDFAAGWQTHTDLIVHALAGTPAPGFMTTFSPLRAHYAGLPAAVTLFERVLAGWNAHDADAMSAPLAEHCTMIGFDGSEMSSRDAVAESLRIIWAHHQTPAYVARIRSVRMAAPGTAVLQARTGLVSAGRVNPATNAVTTLVAVQDAEAGDWRVVLYQHTPAAWHGRPDNATALAAELQSLADAKETLI
jgi:uncharacterized protein (TIGR02246 family)